MSRVQHTMPSPFPVLAPDGSVIIDERCRCGQLRSVHEDTAAYGHGSALPRLSHGEYTKFCPRFTWAAMVYGNHGGGSQVMDPEDYLNQKGGRVG